MAYIKVETEENKFKNQAATEPEEAPGPASHNTGRKQP